MAKQYIEFILKNEQHLKFLMELQEKIENIDDSTQLKKEFVNFIEENYIFDDECDPYGAIEEGYIMAQLHYPDMLIFEMKREQEKRHKRKRQPKSSWDKLKEYGLELEGK
ncbi:hypothetical protein ACQRXC_29220 (plasmid) [Niallia taxi]|uniref:hypothetical protein n=1 Tax=Niallia taxi TaxID=2499688 RepID=UPI003F629D47